MVGLDIRILIIQISLDFSSYLRFEQIIIIIALIYYAKIALDPVKRFVLFELQVIWKQNNKDYTTHIQIIVRKEFLATMPVMNQV